MSAITRLFVAALTLGLAGCGQSAGFPQTGLAGGAEPVTPGVQATEGVEIANAPPLPVRNARIKRRTGKPAVASAASPAATANLAAAKPNESSLPSISNLFTGSALVSDTSQWDNPPVEVYTQVAQQIRACWFTPGATKLPNYGFHAQVAPDDSRDATIVIYEKVAGGGFGPQAFRINISSGLSGSTVTAENRKLDEKLQTAFKADLVRWSTGNRNCQG